MERTLQSLRLWAIVYSMMASIGGRSKVDI